MPTALTLPRIVLASTSVYRQELLRRLIPTFDIVAPDIDESPLPQEAPEATALRLSEQKARAVAPHFPDALIIGSDQVAALGDQRFGKPGTHPAAVAQHQAMRGQTLTFHTGLALLNTRTGHCHTTCVPVRVRFRPNTDAQIEAYLRREPAYHCAGSAKSEGLGIRMIESMEGSDPNALVGLPLIALCDLLALEGIDPLQWPAGAGA